MGFYSQLLGSHQQSASVANPQFANRLNGNNFLNLGVTVQHDSDADTLTGGIEQDWFFASLRKSHHPLWM